MDIGTFGAHLLPFLTGLPSTGGGVYSSSGLPPSPLPRTKEAMRNRSGHSSPSAPKYSGAPTYCIRFSYSSNCRDCMEAPARKILPRSESSNGCAGRRWAVGTVSAIWSPVSYWRRGAGLKYLVAVWSAKFLRLEHFFLFVSLRAHTPIRGCSTLRCGPVREQPTHFLQERPDLFAYSGPVPETL